MASSNCRYVFKDIHYHFEVGWPIHAFVNYAIIGQNNGLTPIQRQTIIWSNAGLSLIAPSVPPFRFQLYQYNI